MRTGIDSSTVKRYGTDSGASVVGIAASEDFTLAPDGFKPSDVLKGCVSVIVLGIPFPREALAEDAADYIDIRNAVNERTSEAAKEVAKRIKADGYEAKAMSGLGGKYVDGMQHGHISMKHAAELAGLGLINRNYLLTNSGHGNLLWFSAVLTDARLAPDERARYKICDNCGKCVEACPSGALDDPAPFGKKIVPRPVLNMWTESGRSSAFCAGRRAPIASVKSDRFSNDRRGQKDRSCLITAYPIIPSKARTLKAARKRDRFTVIKTATSNLLLSIRPDSISFSVSACFLCSVLISIAESLMPMRMIRLSAMSALTAEETDPLRNVMMWIPLGSLKAAPLHSPEIL
jgi:ferredoxin